jgi:hypothetical protein
MIHVVLYNTGNVSAAFLLEDKKSRRYIECVFLPVRHGTETWRGPGWNGNSVFPGVMVLQQWMDSFVFRN